MEAQHAILFEPVKIGPRVAPNRFAAVPYSVGHSHRMVEGHIGIRAMRAEGGWGIVSTGLTEIDPSSDLSNLPYERLWNGKDVARHARIAAAVQAHGALAAVELGHTGLRSRGVGTGYVPMAASAGPILKPDVPFYARAMDKRDIAQFRASHRAAVGRARAAGYDIAYVYAAHDASLLWHFLSPAYNQRTDEYGGPFDNRLRLLREVLTDALEEAGGKMAIALRFAVHEMSGPKRILHDGEGRAVVEALADLPDLWDVNVSGWSRDSATSRFDEEGHQEDFTAFVKQVTSKPVIGVGRYTSPDRMASAIKSGRLDIIGAARPSIADPFLPAKIKEGRAEDIRECIGCNVCVAMDGYGVQIRCTQNPTVSEEQRRGWHPERVTIISKPATALIAGGGPAGLEAALTLARAGVEVTLAERSNMFGGRVALESKLNGLSAWGRVSDYRLYQLRQLANVQLYPNSALDAEGISAFGADHVLLATGSHWRADGSGRSRLEAIPGFAGQALTPDDVMAGVKLSGPVVIYDDEHNYMANVLALHLAAQGHAVHLITPLPSIGSWLAYTLEQPRVIAALHGAGVAMLPGTVATAWHNGRLQVSRADTGQALPSIPADALITVGARVPNLDLAGALEAEGIPHTVIGDAEAPGLIQAAVYSAHRHARELLGETGLLDDL